jgi:hypothetical protein
MGTEAFWTVSDSDLQRIVDEAVRAADRHTTELVRAHTLRVSLIGALVLFSVALASFEAGVSPQLTCTITPTTEWQKFGSDIPGNALALKSGGDNGSTARAE